MRGAHGAAPDSPDSSDHSSDWPVYRTLRAWASIRGKRIFWRIWLARATARSGELHKAFAHKRSTLTSFLDRLAERRLIRREVRSEDRRSFVVSLTPAGKVVGRKIHRHLETLEKAALRGAKPSKTKAFTDLIGAVEEAATRL